MEIFIKTSRGVTSNLSRNWTNLNQYLSSAVTPDRSKCERFQATQQRFLAELDSKLVSNSPRFEFTHSVLVVHRPQTLVLHGACVPLPWAIVCTLYSKNLDFIAEVARGHPLKETRKSMPFSRGHFSENEAMLSWKLLAILQQSIIIFRYLDFILVLRTCYFWTLRQKLFLGMLCCDQTGSF